MKKITINYDKRWIVEIYFSGLKRVMGEIVKAKRFEYIAQEMAMMAHYYNILRQIVEAYHLCNILINKVMILY